MTFAPSMLRTCLRVAVVTGLLTGAAAASAQPVPATNGSLTVRGTAQFGAEAPVQWSVKSAQVAGGTLTMQLMDASGADKGDFSVSPWPYRKHLHGGLALGLTTHRIKPGAVKVTASSTLQPFGPVQRLVVQPTAAKLPTMIVQTRAQSGQLVVAGWRSVYAGNGWEFQRTLPSESPAAESLKALMPQRLRSQGQSWCVTSWARAENQESPPLLDWVAVVAPAKRRCPV